MQNINLTFNIATDSIQNSEFQQEMCKIQQELNHAADEFYNKPKVSDNDTLNEFSDILLNIEQVKQAEKNPSIENNTLLFNNNFVKSVLERVERNHIVIELRQHNLETTFAKVEKLIQTSQSLYEKLLRREEKLLAQSNILDEEKQSIADQKKELEIFEKNLKELKKHLEEKQLANDKVVLRIKEDMDDLMKRETKTEHDENLLVQKQKAFKAHMEAEIAKLGERIAESEAKLKLETKDFENKKSAFDEIVEQFEVEKKVYDDDISYQKKYVVEQLKKIEQDNISIAKKETDLENLTLNIQEQFKQLKIRESVIEMRETSYRTSAENIANDEKEFKLREQQLAYKEEMLINKEANLKRETEEFNYIKENFITSLTKTLSTDVNVSEQVNEETLVIHPVKFEPKKSESIKTVKSIKTDKIFAFEDFNY
ncbi:MAG: hypothetical protein ACRCZI_03295 [Cetobacterium sp.]